MPAGFNSYSVFVDQSFQAQLDRAKATVSDLSPAFRLIAADFRRSEQAIFKLSGPGQYPDFKVSSKTGMSAYKLRKQKKWGFAYPLLKASGALQKSVTEEGDPNSILAIGKQELFIGTSLKYAVFHQSDDSRKKIPLRKFLFVGPESYKFASSKTITGRLERWNNILNNFVLRSLGAPVKDIPLGGE